MAWEVQEALEYYKKQGAPSDQNALVNLLREIQQEQGGSISWEMLRSTAQAYHVKESYLQAIIRRIPSLRMADKHVLEVCAGPNCGKAAQLAVFAEGLQSDKVQVKFVPCMRMCAQGPNVRLDGVRYGKMDPETLKKLTETI